jgi:hypothetical protein
MFTADHTPFQRARRSALLICIQRCRQAQARTSDPQAWAAIGRRLSHYVAQLGTAA